VESYDSECSVKRCLAAAVIVLAWTKVLTSVVSHPSLEGNPTVILTIFYRVVDSFRRILAWYSFLIVSFGLGFYIMLHKDTGKMEEDNPQCPCEDPPYPFFDNPWLALVKSCTMFVGEIEFADVPVEGGNVSVVLGYIFLLAFVFLVIMVLSNLLNGWAIVDIGQTLEESEVATYKTTIESLAYMESLLMGDPSGYDDFYHSGGRGRGEWNLSLRDVLLKACPPFTKAFQKLVGSTGMLLFYTSLKKKQMILPRRRKAGISKGNEGNCCQNAVSMIDPNRGNLVIVQEAKEILLQRYKDKAEAESALESQVQKLSEDVTQIKNMFEEIKAALTKLPTNA